MCILKCVCMCNVCMRMYNLLLVKYICIIIYLKNNIIIGIVMHFLSHSLYIVKTN